MDKTKKRAYEALRLEISLDGRFAWLFQGQELVYTLAYRKTSRDFEIIPSEPEYMNALTDEIVHNYFNMLLEDLLLYKHEVDKLLEFRDSLEGNLSILTKIIKI